MPKLGPRSMCDEYRVVRSKFESGKKAEEANDEQKISMS